MAEPSVGLWRPKWRREGQDPPLLWIQELEPSSLPVKDNPHVEDEVGVNLWDASSFADLPLIQLLGRRVELCNTPGRHRRHHLHGDARCAETAPTYSVSAALCSLRMVHFFYLQSLLTPRKGGRIKAFASHLLLRIPQLIKELLLWW